MARSRADEILEGWKMVAHSAAKPADARQPKVFRSSLSLGLAGTAIAAILVVAALSLRGGFGPQSPIPGATPSPTAMASSSAAPTASSSVTPTTSAQMPTAADVAAASQAVELYTHDLVQGDYAAAWAMLGPEAQTHFGSLANFTYERSAFFTSVAGRYVVTPNPTDVGPITDWLPSTYGASIDLHHAVLVEVTYPALAGNNAGFDLYIVNPGSTGLQIYDVR